MMAHSPKTQIEIRVSEMRISEMQPFMAYFEILRDQFDNNRKLSSAEIGTMFDTHATYFPREYGVNCSACRTRVYNALLYLHWLMEEEISRRNI